MKSHLLPGSMFAILILAILALPSCKSEEKKAGTPPSFQVMEIKAKKVPVFIQTVGQTMGIPTVEIRARVAGYLRSWDFREGSIVKKGQVLFTIEPDEYKNSLALAEADLDSRMAAWEKAKLDVQRLKPLVQTKAISQNDYDVAVTTEQQTKAAVASSRASLDQARLNLSYTTMEAPITGAIGACAVNPGNLVGKGEATLLTTVSVIDPMYVYFQMNEGDYLKIMRFIEKHPEYKDKENTFTIFLTLADKEAYHQPGKIDFIDRQVNPTTGTITVRGVFPNTDGLIKPGSFVTVNLVLMEQENGIVIPQSATTTIQGKAFAFLVDGQNKVTRTPIVLGRSVGSNYIINGGLKAGDRIMLEGFQKFQEGMQIQPVEVQDTISVPARPQ